MPAVLELILSLALISKRELVGRKRDRGDKIELLSTPLDMKVLDETRVGKTRIDIEHLK